MSKAFTPGEVVFWRRDQDNPQSETMYGIALGDDGNRTQLGVIDAVRGVMWQSDLITDRLGNTTYVSWHVTPVGFRVDGFTFFGMVSPDGAQAYIIAGCRGFTIPRARIWWKGRERNGLFGGGHTNRKLNDWSLAYVDRVAKLQERVQKAALRQFKAYLKKMKRV